MISLYRIHLLEFQIYERVVQLELLPYESTLGYAAFDFGHQ